jgi:hypothetical protein
MACSAFCVRTTTTDEGRGAGLERGPCRRTSRWSEPCGRAVATGGCAGTCNGTFCREDKLMRTSRHIAALRKGAAIAGAAVLASMALATGATASAGTTSGAAEAKAGSPQAHARTVPKRNTVLCPVDDQWVPESTSYVLGSTWLRYGQSATVTPDNTAQIWAGVWFTGGNGPAGWTDSTAGYDYPLPGWPPYSLIGRIGNGPWQYIGNRPLTFTNVKYGYLQKVVLRTNDNYPGNGSGAFHAYTAYPCTGK